jgi:hypothetical protein
MSVEARQLAVAHLRATIRSASASIATALDSVVAAIDALYAEQPMTEAPNVGPLLTIDEAAAIVGMSRDTLDEYARKGTLVSVVLPSGRGDREMRRFLGSDLNAFMLRYRKAA